MAVRNDQKGDGRSKSVDKAVGIAGDHFKRDFEKHFCEARSLDFSRAINPTMHTFETWLAENMDRIPLEEDARRASGE